MVPVGLYLNFLKYSQIETPIKPIYWSFLEVVSAYIDHLGWNRGLKPANSIFLQWVSTQKWPQIWAEIAKCWAPSGSDKITYPGRQWILMVVYYINYLVKLKKPKIFLIHPPIFSSIWMSCFFHFFTKMAFKIREIAGVNTFGGLFASFPIGPDPKRPFMKFRRKHIQFLPRNSRK